MNSDDMSAIGEGFSSLDLIYQCLIDDDKYQAFDKALRDVIVPDSRVLELGTGSGILSMIAGRAGAKKVTAVEFDPAIADVARQNVLNNDLGDCVDVVTGDARTITFTEPFDVVVMEMLATGLVDEMQVLAMNNLHRQGLITEATIVIPFAQENYVSLVHANFAVHGFTMSMVSHLWSHDDYADKFKELTKPAMLNNVCFAHENEEVFSGQVVLDILTDGEVNSICLSSTVVVDQNRTITLDSTSSLSPLVLVPLPLRAVKAGERVTLEIEYTFGGGFSNFKARYI